MIGCKEEVQFEAELHCVGQVMASGMSWEHAGDLKSEVSLTTSDTCDDSEDEDEDDGEALQGSGGGIGESRRACKEHVRERKVASNQSMLHENTVCVLLRL